MQRVSDEKVMQVALQGVGPVLEGNLALDLLEARAALSACEADYAEAVRALDRVIAPAETYECEHGYTLAEPCPGDTNENDAPIGKPCPMDYVRAVLSTPRARRVLETP